MQGHFEGSPGSTDIPRYIYIQIHTYIYIYIHIPDIVVNIDQNRRWNRWAEPVVVCDCGGQLRSTSSIFGLGPQLLKLQFFGHTSDSHTHLEMLLIRSDVKSQCIVDKLIQRHFLTRLRWTIQEIHTFNTFPCNQKTWGMMSQIHSFAKARWRLQSLHSANISCVTASEVWTLPHWMWNQWTMRSCWRKQRKYPAGSLSKNFRFRIASKCGNNFDWSKKYHRHWAMMIDTKFSQGFLWIFCWNKYI